MEVLELKGEDDEGDEDKKKVPHNIESTFYQKQF